MMWAKEDGTKVVSIDALFGLPRRKLAGQSHRNSLHGSLFFADQLLVDSFVENSQKAKIKIDQVSNIAIHLPCYMHACIFLNHIILINQECSEFKAGDALRSASRYHKLDETGLFGSACRHEFPMFVYNLKHGER